MSVELSVDDVQRLLGELGRRLDAAGHHATLYLVGGAAVALSVDVRRVTRDIDALFDDDLVRRVAAEMAQQLDLAPDWLNSAARPFTPGTSDPGATTFEVPGLSVAVASPRHLLAMKLAAFRPQDVRDAVAVARILRLRSATEIAAVAIEVYGDYLSMFATADEVALRSEAVAELIGGARDAS
jgi:hypothetical protein